MLLRQKAIVEGSFALLGTAARYADLAEHAATSEERERAQLLLDLLTPIAKTFPAERGFEANALAIQIHGGYGYTSEYLPESYMRDQKLNSLHEGTSGIQSIDLLARKVSAKSGASFVALLDEMRQTVREARSAGCPESWCNAVEEAVQASSSLTAELAQRAMSSDAESAMAHSWDYLDLLSTVVIAWQWLKMSAAAKSSTRLCEARALGTQTAAQYWICTELPRVALLAELCRTNERSYLDAQAEWF
jgi:butyryl-CoA dehydrogenase